MWSVSRQARAWLPGGSNEIWAIPTTSTFCSKWMITEQKRSCQKALAFPKDPGRAEKWEGASVPLPTHTGRPALPPMCLLPFLCG